MEANRAPEDKRRAILVLGMHRSGTSLVTSLLAAVGVPLGSNLMPPRWHNPRGFFEDVALVRLNDEILAELDAGYECVGLIDLSARSVIGWPEMFQKARTALATSMGDRRLWGFKDPRMCRLLWFWNRLFKDFDIAPASVLVVRNPLSVAASLSDRDFLPRELGALLWLEHVLMAIRDASDLRVVVDYDVLLSSPVEQVSRIALRLDLMQHLQSVENLEQRCRQIVDPALAHKRFQIHDLERDPAIPEVCIRAYRLLRDVAEDRLDMTGAEFGKSWDRILTLFGEMQPALQVIGQMQRRYATSLRSSARAGGPVGVDEAVRFKLKEAEAILRHELRPELFEALRTQVAEGVAREASLREDIDKQQSQLKAAHSDLLAAQAHARAIEASRTWKWTAWIRALRQHLFAAPTPGGPS